ncbi:MAG: PEGA domain-containing protein [Candidatus Riflebacteria bacterium]|nr:PEGA domain-containing protein [Candidatus Riflebacteria bacterium]
MKLKNILFALLVFCFLLMPVWADQPAASLLTPDHAEYVIVTPLRYAAIFQQLADWKTAKGVPAKVMTLEDIQRLYKDAAGDKAAKIRTFLKDAWRTWNTRWVLLGGDTADKDGAMIPARYIKSSFSMGENIPSDLYYANFDGTWDGNNNGIYGEVEDNCNLAPEIYLGRASVDSAEEASTFVEKVLKYEMDPPPNWAKKVLLIGGNLNCMTKGQNDIDIMGRECFNNFSQTKMTEENGAKAEDIRDAMTKTSPHFVYVTAHGDPDGFMAGGIFKLEYADQLANSFPFIYAAMSCNTNYFDTDCLSEHFLTAPKGGAVAYWACSRFGWFQAGNEGYYGSILMIKDFFNLLIKDPKDVSNHLGEAVTRARMRYIPEASKGECSYRWLIFGMNLLGDPEMPVWTDEPASLAADVDIDKSGTTATIRVTSKGTPVANAQACVTFADEKSLRLVVTAWNRIPKEIKVDHTGIPGLYSTGKTDASGKCSLSLKGSKKLIAAKINSLVSLNRSLRDIAAYMQKIRSNSRVFEKLTHDYQYQQHVLDRTRREVRAYLGNLMEAQQYAAIEETLLTIETRAKAAPDCLEQFRFVLKAVTDKMRFNLAQMQQDESSAQLRILNKALEIGGNLNAADGSKPEKPTPMPAKSTGQLSVTTEPAGAQVYLNNVPKGETPCTIANLAFGVYTLKIHAQGQAAISKKIQIKDGKMVREHFALQSNCSLSGQVVLENGKPCAECRIVVYYRDSQTNKKTILGEGTADAKGHFQYLGMPKRDLNLEIRKAGYTVYWKQFRYSDRDQGYHRHVTVKLVPWNDAPGQASQTTRLQ